MNVKDQIKTYDTPQAEKLVNTVGKALLEAVKKDKK